MVRFHAPSRRPKLFVGRAFLAGMALCAVCIALSGFFWPQFLPNPPSRYDAMKIATVELFFSHADDKGKAHHGHGSGVILSPNFILTVAHVGAASDTGIEDVLFADGSKGQAMLLWSDPSRDVALLILKKATKLQPAVLSRVAVTAGQEIWASGYPMDLPLSVQHGEIVSGELGNMEVAPGADPVKSVIFTNVTMGPGDSGGPVYDSRGEVVGLNDFIAEGIGSFGGVVAVQAILADVRAVTGIN